MHGIFRGREVGVGPELISGVPQAAFNLRDVVEGVGGHLGGGDLLVLAVCRGGVWAGCPAGAWMIMPSFGVRFRWVWSAHAGLHSKAFCS